MKGRAPRTCVLSTFAAFNRRTTSPCSLTRFSNVSLSVSSAIASKWHPHAVSRGPDSVRSALSSGALPYNPGNANRVAPRERERFPSLLRRTSLERGSTRD